MVNFIVLQILKDFSVNSEDFDQMLQSTVSDLVLHCLPMSL